jgi:hypothetical protein
MQEVSEVHAQELAIRDAQVTALQNQLASFGVGPRYVGFSGIFLALIYYSLVNPALVDEDIPMPLQVGIGLPSLPESSQKKSHNRRDGPSVSARRSSRLASKKAQVSMSTPQASALPSTWQSPPSLPVMLSGPMSGSMSLTSPEVPPIQILKKPGVRKFQLTKKELPKDIAGLLVCTSLYLCDFRLT